MGATHHRSDRDYVLGTHDAEVARLAFQHSIWRSEVLRAWSGAGIGRGSRVLDVGAGPGFATLDLADIVGDGGEVTAVERSARFLELLRAEAQARGHGNVRTAELDLMHDPLPTPSAGAGFDAAWCRWVACFVPDPGLLVRRMAEALRPGGTAVFHEYHEYATYRVLPVRAEITAFVEAVFETWRAQGGEPNIARALPRLLVDAGLEIVSVRPLARAARPGEELWNWPAGFVRVNTPRLVEIGARTVAWGESVLKAVDEAERDPASVFMTPTVLEIVARKA
ncbi:MAG: class I SAM-dependent methyltransferase [Phycisphaerales bacterium]